MEASGWLQESRQGETDGSTQLPRALEIQLLHPRVLKTPFRLLWVTVRAAPEACPVRTQVILFPHTATLANVTRQTSVTAGCEQQDV